MAQPTASALAGTANPEPLFLWSTNPHMKFWIQQRYSGGSHYVWCSPAFAGASLNRYAIGAGQSGSSDPCTIYRQLHKAVTDGDGGDMRIAKWKKDMTARAVEWVAQERISVKDSEEIAAIIEQSHFNEWRPLVYVIPFSNVSGRVKLVDRHLRASREPEYVIEDLMDGEFEIIEPWPI